MTLSEILVASFTLMLVIVGVLQWCLIRRQDQHFRMSERAWVLVKIGGEISHSPPDPDKDPYSWIEPIIENRGKTIARIKRLVVRPERVPAGQTLPPRPEYPLPAPGFDPPMDMVLPPGISNSPALGIPSAIHAIEVADMLDDKITLYVHGFVDYLDFNGKERHSGFCYIYWAQKGLSPVKSGFYIDFGAPPAYTECT